MHLKLTLAAALCAAPLSAQVVDLANSCTNNTAAPALAGSIVSQDVTITMTSPSAPYTPISFGMFVIGFSNLSGLLPCGCTLVPSLDVLEVGSFFDAPSPTIPAQLLITIPTGLTGSLLYFQGIEFFQPGSQTTMGCSFVGLDFDLTNALEVTVP